MPNYGVNVQRSNQDTKPVNKNGERLLDLCQNHNLFIVNGRFGDDANIDKTTCKDVSVIDYAIVLAQTVNR